MKTVIQNPAVNQVVDSLPIEARKSFYLRGFTIDESVWEICSKANFLSQEMHKEGIAMNIVMLKDHTEVKMIHTKSSPKKAGSKLIKEAHKDSQADIDAMLGEMSAFNPGARALMVCDTIRRASLSRKMPLLTAAMSHLSGHESFQVVESLMVDLYIAPHQQAGNQSSLHRLTAGHAGDNHIVAMINVLIRDTERAAGIAVTERLAAVTSSVVFTNNMLSSLNRMTNPIAIRLREEIEWRMNLKSIRSEM